MQASRQQGSAAFAAEVSVRLDMQIDGVQTRLAGRVDGLFRSDQCVWRVEEYKATRAVDVALNPVDWGQCLIYAGLLCTQESIERIELAVVYVHPDTLAEQVFERSVCAKTAQGSLALALLCFEVRQSRHRLRCEAREAWMQARDFPFQRYRSAQRLAVSYTHLTLPTKA